MSTRPVEPTREPLTRVELRVGAMPRSSSGPSGLSARFFSRANWAKQWRTAVDFFGEWIEALPTRDICWTKRRRTYIER